MKLGLFGGSFDPVHLGHLLMAQAALEELALDIVFFIPAAQSPFKPGKRPAPAAERVRMLRLALTGQTRCQVDDQEIIRGGVSYTIDTVRGYRDKFPGAGLVYLIGADHVPQLPKWRDAVELAELVEFAVIPRPDEKPVALPQPFRGRYLQGFPVGVSSSQIRERVQQGLPITHLVTREVAEAIRNNRLYL